MPNNKGFAIALDALMAIILVTALIVFLSQQPELPAPGIDASQRLKEISTNAFTALDNSGALGRLLVERPFDVNSAADVNREAKKLVPKNVDLKIKVTVFEPAVDMSACRNNRNFSSCFTQKGSPSIGGDEPPIGKEVVYGKRLLAIRQPTSEATGPNGEVLCTLGGGQYFFQKPRIETKPFSIAFLDANLPTVEYKTTAFQNTIKCADNDPPSPGPPQTPPNYAEYSTVTLFARNQTRNPVDVFLVMDKSGSMGTYDMNLQTKSGTFDDGTCIFTSCVSSDVLSTNCGIASGSAPATSCGTVDGPYSNFTTLNNNWKLTDGNYQLLNDPNAPNSRLYFGQFTSGESPYYYYGVCAGCDSSDSSSSRTPFIRANRNSPYLEANREWASAVYFNRTSVAANDTFTIKGWNSDSGGSLATTAFITPSFGIAYLPQNHGTIPKVPDVYNCQYTFVNNPSQCTGGPLGIDQCNDYNRFRRFAIPDDIHILDGKPAPDRNVVYKAVGFLHFEQLTDACRPGIKVIYTPPGGDPKVDGQALSPPSFDCYDNPNPTSCYFYFPNNGDWRYDNYTKRVPGGTYDFYVASQKDLVSASSDLTYELFVGHVYSPPQHYNNGKCTEASQECFLNVVTPSNCPVSYANEKPYFYQAGDSYMRATNEKVLDTFRISGQFPYLRGLREETKLWAYYGTCYRTAIGFVRPSDDSNHVVFGGGSTRSISYGLNDPPYQDYVHLNYNSAVPLPDGNYFAKGWASPPGQTSFSTRWLEQRMDAAQEAASNFIDNNSWKTEDRIGIVTFSDDKNLAQNLVNVDDTNRGKLKQKLKDIRVGGETNIYAALSEAHTDIKGGINRKFIILLSDGLANRPSGDPVQDAQLAITEALNAFKIDGIITYTIGFGVDAIDFNRASGKWQCKDTLTQIALAGGGKCYPANDKQQLSEIFALLAGTVQQEFGDTNIEMPLYPGMLIDSPACGANECPGGIALRTYSEGHTQYSDTNWGSMQWHLAAGDESLVFKSVLINQVEPNWWDANFNVAVPCATTTCFKELVLPPTGEGGTTLSISNPPTVLYWKTNDGQGDPEQQTIKVLYRDLGIQFVDGNVFGGETRLRFKLSNMKDLDIDFRNHQEPMWPNGSCSVGQIEVRFFQNAVHEPPDFNKTPVFNMCVTPDPSGDNILTPEEFQEFYKAVVGTTGGYIYAVIDPNRGTNPVKECKENNWSKIFCFANPLTNFFVLEYWSWFD